MSCCDRSKGLQHVAAHVEVDLAGQQQRTAGDLRPALHDLHVEAASRIGAVRERLVVAAMLGLGEPVRPEGHLRQVGREYLSGHRPRAVATTVAVIVVFIVVSPLWPVPAPMRVRPGIRSSKRRAIALHSLLSPVAPRRIAPMPLPCLPVACLPKVWPVLALAPKLCPIPPAM